MPRKFDATEEDQIIYDEEEEEPEMYFITEGMIGIGFSLGPIALCQNQSFHLRNNFDVFQFC